MTAGYASMVALIGGFCGLVVLFLFHLARAPYLIVRDRCRELEAEIEPLREKVRPKLKLALVPSIGEVQAGNTLTTRSGGVQAVWSMASHAIKLTCTNVTTETLSSVTVFLAKAARIHADGTIESIPIQDEIEFAWNVTGAVEQGGVALLPDRSRSVYLLLLRPGALMTLFRSAADLNQLPTRYHLMFSGNHTYRIRVGAQTESGSPFYLDLEIRNGNPPSDGTPDPSLVTVRADSREYDWGTPVGKEVW